MSTVSLGLGLAAVVALAGTNTVFGQPVEDFHLNDVNPLSPRYGNPVSPRDYLLQVSGFYFGAAS